MGNDLEPAKWVADTSKLYPSFDKPDYIRSLHGPLRSSYYTLERREGELLKTLTKVNVCQKTLKTLSKIQISIKT